MSDTTTLVSPVVGLPSLLALTAEGTSVDEVSARLRRQGVCSLSDLVATKLGADRREYLIDGLIGMRQIVLLAGDSGLGKSPLLYQITLCLAAGRECLGVAAKQAATLYLDFENSRENAAVDIVQPMLTALRLTEPPPLWSAWYYLDSPASAKPEQIVDDWLSLPELQGLPKLVVIDPYEAWPGASIKNEEVRKVYKRFRCWQHQQPVTVWLPHHVNKEPTRKEDRDAMPELEGNPRQWISQRMRGGMALLNASDVRLGIKESGEDGLFIAGSRRGKGKVGPIYITRDFNEDGEATHYSRASLIERLAADPARSDEIKKFRALADTFKTGDVKRIFGYEHNQQVNRLLNRWKESDGLIRKGTERGVWYKAPGESM